MVRVVWLLRHGQRQDRVAEDWEARADRVHDPGLTDRGHRQATAAGERLRGEGIGAIYASPFLRALQTAGHVAAALDRPVRVEPGLSEHLNPDWFDAHPALLDPDERDEHVPRLAGHEPLLEPTFPEDHDAADARLAEAAGRIVDAASAEQVLLVGHGATVGGVAAGLAGATADVDAPLCGLTKLVCDGDADGAAWRVESTGETSHLD